MYKAAFDHELFYSVSPGDSLWKVAQSQFGLKTTGDANSGVQRILSLNPHIKDPNKIFPGDLLLLGSPARMRTDRPLYPQDLAEAQKVWKTTSPNTREAIRRNFDILDWLSDRVDQADFLNSSSQETALFWNEVKPFSAAIQKANLLKLSQYYEELAIVRRETIVLLSQYRLSVTRMPIFLISVKANGLYGYAQKLLRMIELANRFNVGKILLAADIAIEAAKVAQVGIETRDPRATARQASKSAMKVGTGLAAGTLAGKYGCRTMIQIGKLYGVAGCAILVGVGIWWGQSQGEKLGERMYDGFEKTFLKPLP